MATWHAYPKTFQGMLQGTANAAFDWDTDTIKMALVTASYSPDPDTHDFWNDVSANECSGTGYSANGVTLTCTMSYIAASNRVALVAADPTFSAITITTIRYAVVFKSTGTASTSPLIAYVDLGAQSVTAADFIVDCDGTNGIIYLDAA